MSIMAPSKPPRTTTTIESLQRTKSDMSFHLLAKDILDNNSSNSNSNSNSNSSCSLPTVLEVEVAKCECCGMSEECTKEYIEETREKYAGRVVCGLCGEAVKEEMEKNGGRSREVALEEHMSACVRFNRFGRAYPALYQADNVKKILKKSATTTTSAARVKASRMGGIARSSSCIPAITDDMKDKLRV
ncbi:hypothetical protein RND81_08G198100 [Saponaria officinalis]|uniref:Uncharacterized protein n=1 Tax=Saponaria officinalis TaxID=3572 RepID=A0AAW1JB98_SAPOF